MKLNRLERRLLRFIDARYSVAWKASDQNEILAVGERQLPTVEFIIGSFVNEKDEILRSGLESLVGYQCLKKVTLLNRGDFEELTVGVGQTIRTAIAKAGKGTVAVQITDEGKTAIADFWWSKAKRLGGVWGTKISEDYAPMVFTFIIGFLLASLFGIDLKKILGR